ncbi:MAG TPA: acyl-CoA dehydrogenase family protein [Actinomycetota bacterium]|nr:acyl-CoA dehydrogenase family protein [Actinomycetota bacterium]
MDFSLNEDQLSLQKSAREFLTKECAIEMVHRSFDGPDGDAPELYAHMADLGWLGLAVPEEHGGVGFGVVEQAVLFEQLGYFNAPGAFFSNTALVIPALIAVGATDQIAEVVEGKTRYAYVQDPDFVLDGQLADKFVVVSDEVRIIDASDATVTALESIDGTRRFASVQTRAGAGHIIGSADGLERVLDIASTLLCAESVGGMQRVLEQTVEYAKVRTQFDRPIGSFQAVKHQLADALLRVESSRSAALYAAWANSVGAPDAKFASSVAKAYIAEAAVWVTGAGVQLHGGIGFTWEHDSHLYFKRAVTNAALLGDAAHHRARALSLSPFLGE